ncbi:hypothetical protein TRFO_16930 [Tritrichomonas foetus]|uniref:Uncharacterized protein n=1 Tax=Tritrichomonas foetus TaxID=1144522 RepID=A0A1J4KU16_9EUKA|nr:hypothetical protein TRFO_16930 [Tritrichomonas foetus]|eukprot:OHT12981.1 hypothetical protein TRFO_16930 [Tritrichomonas foetus]
MSQNFQILCQSAVKEDTAAFIDKQFSSFFTNFYNFISQYQKPYHPGAFKKNPLKIFDDILTNVKIIISKTTPNHYKPQMKNDMQNTFIALLHPLTPEKIRDKSITLFFIVVDKLNENIQNFFDDNIYKLVFDFNVIKDECGADSAFELSVDPNKRIQVGDSEKTSKENFYQKLDNFTDNLFVAPDPKFLRVFPLFAKMILVPTYSHVIGQSKFGVSDKAPKMIHRAVAKVLTNATTRPSCFKLIFKENSQYFFEAATQSSTAHIQIEESWKFLNDFFRLIGDKSTPDNLKGITIDLTLKGLVSLQNLIRIAVSQPNFPIPVFEITMSYFMKWFKVFKDNRLILSQNLLKGTTEETLPQILAILLASFINMNVNDDQLWGLLHNYSEFPSIFLSAFSFFSSYFSVCISQTLLDFTVKDLTSELKCTDPQEIWLGDKKYVCLKKLYSLNIDQLFVEEKNTFSLCPNFNIKMPPIDSDVWLPFVTMIKNMKWQEISDQEIQFRTYLVGASFVYPLVKLITNFPPGMKYSVNFIIENFMDWLRECCSPNSKNAKVVLSALDILGIMFSDSKCIQSISKEVAFDWLLTLQVHMKSDDQKIRSKAVNLACSAIFHGFSGSSFILNDDIVNTLLLTPNEKMTSLQMASANSAKLAKLTDQNLRISYLMKVLMEDVYKKDATNLDNIITEVFEILKTLPGEIAYVYNLWPIILFIQELSKLNESVVDRLINESAELVEKSEINFSEVMLQFLSDLIVYSSSKKGIERFLKLPDNLQQKHVSLYISKYFNNLSFTKYVNNSLDKQFFTNGQQEIIQLYDYDKIAIHVAAGNSAYRFSQPEVTDYDHPIVPQSEFTDAIPIPEPENFDVQTNLNNIVSDYFNDGLYNPSDFQIDQITISEPETFEENYSQKLIEAPLTYGSLPASFVSSTGFMDPISSYKFIPCGYQTLQSKIDISYKKKVTVGLRNNKIESKAYQLFEKGLGGLNEASQEIIYSDCRHDIIFVKNSKVKANDIEVIWNINDAASFIPEQKARIQVDEIGEEFLVKTYFKKEKDLQMMHQYLADAVVSAQVLPTFIISKVLTISKMLKEKNNSKDKTQKAASDLRKIEEENFPQRSSLFANEKALRGAA